MSFSSACIAVTSVAALALAACSSGGSPNDGGTESSVESGAGDTGTTDTGASDSAADGSDDVSTCTTTLCIHPDQPNQCPSCAPSDGDICSPPAAVTCNYSNGCSGAAEQTRQCMCVLPDAGADGGSSDAIWHCTNGP